MNLLSTLASAITDVLMQLYLSLCVPLLYSLLKYFSSLTIQTVSGQKRELRTSSLCIVFCREVQLVSVLYPETRELNKSCHTLPPLRLGAGMSSDSVMDRYIYFENHSRQSLPSWQNGGDAELILIHNPVCSQQCFLKTSRVLHFWWRFPAFDKSRLSRVNIYAVHTFVVFLCRFFWM